MPDCVNPNDCRVARETCQARFTDAIAAVVGDLHEALAEEHKAMREIESARNDRQERFQQGVQGALSLAINNAVKAKMTADAAAADVKSLGNRAWALVAAVLIAAILSAGGAIYAASRHVAAAEPAPRAGGG